MTDNKDAKPMCAGSPYKLRNAPLCPNEVIGGFIVKGIGNFHVCRDHFAEWESYLNKGKRKVPHRWSDL